MKKLLIVLFFAGLSLSASAQASHEKTLELFRVMNIDKTMSAVTDNMMAMFAKGTGTAANDKVSKEYMAYVSSEIKLFSTRMTNNMVPIYEAYFTADEIQKYIDFYSTPEGKKLIESGPILQKQMMGNLMTKELPELQAKFKKKLEELRAKK
jgi:hypothetical protein